MAKIVLLSHCLLNNFSKVEPFENDNFRLVEWLIANKIQILQLPCPEFTLYGGRRWGHVQEQFDNPFFRRHCRNLLQTFLDQIREYQSCGHEVAAILGIKGSPSCGVNHTCSSKLWHGEICGGSDAESILDSVSLIEGRGVFIDEFHLLLQKEGLQVPLMEVDEQAIDETIGRLKDLIS